MDISIIIPTYEPKEYLKECLESIDAQSLGTEHYEVIIILNGKTSPYLETIRAIVSRLHFTYKILTTSTPGVSNARNIGLEASTGRYICFIDDDDKVSPDYLEGLLDKAKDNIIVASDVRAFRDDSDTLWSDDYIAKAYRTHKGEEMSVLKGRKFMSSSCCKIISKEAIGNNTFDADIRIGEDSVFMARISKNIKRIRLANERAVYYRRRREKSASRSPYSFSDRITIVRKLLRRYLTMLKPEYNTLFILTRIAAAMLKLRKR